MATLRRYVDEKSAETAFETMNKEISSMIRMEFNTKWNNSLTKQRPGDKKVWNLLN